MSEKIEFEALVDTVGLESVEKAHRAQIELVILQKAERVNQFVQDNLVQQYKVVKVTLEPVYDLRPCPFCGGEAKIDGLIVFCQKCGARISSGLKRAEAIQKWNRRHSPAMKPIRKMYDD